MEKNTSFNIVFSRLPSTNLPLCYGKKTFFTGKTIKPSGLVKLPVRNLRPRDHLCHKKTAWFSPLVRHYENPQNTLKPLFFNPIQSHKTAHEQLLVKPLFFKPMDRLSWIHARMAFVSSGGGIGVGEAPPKPLTPLVSAGGPGGLVARSELLFG